jgi:hypothetical protein
MTGYGASEPVVRPHGPDALRVPSVRFHPLVARSRDEVALQGGQTDCVLDGGYLGRKVFYELRANSGGARLNTGGKRNPVGGRPRNVLPSTGLPQQVSPAKILTPGQKWQFAEYALQHVYEALDKLIHVMRHGESETAVITAADNRTPQVVYVSALHWTVAVMASAFGTEPAARASPSPNQEIGAPSSHAERPRFCSHRGGARHCETTPTATVSHRL